MILRTFKKSSVFSAAKAISDHLREWYNGMPDGHYSSAGIVSSGEYGTREGIVFSMPIQFKGGFVYEVVKGLEIDEYATSKILRN